MNFDDLVGKDFQENEFYELLLYDLEENFGQNFSQFIHFYFERTQEKKVRITEVARFNSSNEMNRKSREVIEKKEWFEIDGHRNLLQLILCRLDRTGWASSIRKDSTRTEEWSRGWADEEPHEPMTREEIRLAFRELAGFFGDQMDLQKLRNKKTV